MMRGRRERLAEACQRACQGPWGLPNHDAQCLMPMSYALCPVPCAYPMPAVPPLCRHAASRAATLPPSRLEALRTLPRPIRGMGEGQPRTRAAARHKCGALFQ